MAQEPYLQPLIGGANVSSVKVDGEVVPGAQSLSIRWERERRNIYELGSELRRGVDFGSLHIVGSIAVQTHFPKLDDLMLAEPDQVKAFQLLVELKKGGTAVRTLAFDHCYLERKEFAIDRNGVGMTTYIFTATKMRET